MLLSEGQCSLTSFGIFGSYLTFVPHNISLTFKSTIFLVKYETCCLLLFNFTCTIENFMFYLNTPKINIQLFYIYVGPPILGASLGCCPRMQR